MASASQKLAGWASAVQDQTFKSWLRQARPGTRAYERASPFLLAGIYRVSHPQHNLPLEVTLLKDQKFPRCSRCNEPVFYELLRSAPAVTSSHPDTFQVELYELPELLPDDEIAS